MSSVFNPPTDLGCNLFSTPSMLGFHLLTTRRTEVRGDSPPCKEGDDSHSKRQCALLLNVVFAILSTDCGIIISYQVKQ